MHLHQIHAALFLQLDGESALWLPSHWRIQAWKLPSESIWLSRRMDQRLELTEEWGQSLVAWLTLQYDGPALPAAMPFSWA